MPGVISHRGAALPPFNDAQKYRFLPWGVLPRGFKIYICMSSARVQWVHATDPHFDVMRVPGVGAQQYTPTNGPTGDDRGVGVLNRHRLRVPNPGRLRESPKRITSKFVSITRTRGGLRARRFCYLCNHHAQTVHNDPTICPTPDSSHFL